MASLYSDTREALLFAYSEDWLDDVEFLVLNELNTSTNVDFPYDFYDQFDLDDIDEAECIAEFRFEKRHILLLEEVLQIMQPEIGFRWFSDVCSQLEEAISDSS